MSESFELEEVDKLTVGTVGEVGQRVFLLQAQQGSQVVTLKVEKEQIRALSKYLADFLKALPRPDHLPEGNELDLIEPTEPEWIVATIALTYESENDRLIFICEEAVFEDADLDLPPAEARFVVTREQIAALAIRGTQLVEAGRPPCPLCGYPLDPEGHACPRTNGHRPPTL